MIHSSIRHGAVALWLALSILGGITPEKDAGAQAPASLSLDQALALAEARSQLVNAFELGARAAREQAIAAGQLPDAVARIGINNLPVSGPDRFSVARDFMTMRSIGVTQELTRQDKRNARSMRFEREADVAQAERTLAVADLRRDTALAWLERHFQERLRTVLDDQRDEARLQVAAAEAAYRGARGSQTDVLTTRLAVAQIEDRIRQADRQAQETQARLGRWLGADSQRPLTALPVMRDPELDANHLDQQLRHHPQIELWASQEAAARADAEAAKLDRRADWSVELMYSQRGPSYSDMVSINASIPLQWDQVNRQDRNWSAKLAVVEKVRAQREDATREHVAEVRGWLVQWRSNQGRLAHYDASLLPLAAERARTALTAYRGGTAPLATVLQARLGELDVRMDRIRLEMETAALWARLKFLIPAAARSGDSGAITRAAER